MTESFSHKELDGRIFIRPYTSGPWANFHSPLRDMVDDKAQYETNAAFAASAEQ